MCSCGLLQKEVNIYSVIEVSVGASMRMRVGGMNYIVNLLIPDKFHCLYLAMASSYVSTLMIK